MTEKDLIRLLEDIRQTRIGVIGDFCLDAYWTMDPAYSEKSLETGLAVRAVESQRYSLGGAGNVANNLVALGVNRVAVFGLHGGDPFGREMLRLLQDLGVDMRGLLFQDREWDTPVYAKPIEREVEQGRINFGTGNRLDPGRGREILRSLKDALHRLDLVIINQQLLHGMHTEEFRRELAAVMEESSSSGKSLPFICDSRHFSDSYTGAIRKLNAREALRLCEVLGHAGSPAPRTRIDQAARTLFERWRMPLFITRGSEGILVHNGEGTKEVPGIRLEGRIDPVGAGDSALAGIAAAVAAGRTGLEAATLGNYTAAVTVRKLLTTGSASPEEILEIARMNPRSTAAATSGVLPRE